MCPQSVPQRRRPRVLRLAGPPRPPGRVCAAASMFVLEERSAPTQSRDAF